MQLMAHLPERKWWATRRRSARSHSESTNAMGWPIPLSLCTGSRQKSHTTTVPLLPKYLRLSWTSTSFPLPRWDFLRTVPAQPSLK